MQTRPLKQLMNKLMNQRIAATEVRIKSTPLSKCYVSLLYPVNVPNHGGTPLLWIGHPKRLAAQRMVEAPSGQRHDEQQGQNRRAGVPLREVGGEGHASEHVHRE